jgi:hypothetical protein
MSRRFLEPFLDKLFLVQRTHLFSPALSLAERVVCGEYPSAQLATGFGLSLGLTDLVDCFHVGLLKVVRLDYTRALILSRTI